MLFCIITCLILIFGLVVIIRIAFQRYMLKCEIVKYLRKIAPVKLEIKKDPRANLNLQTLLRMLYTFRKEANVFWKQRNNSPKEQILTQTKNEIEAQLKKIFSLYSNPNIEFVLMSSFGARMHLPNNSDLDFGVIIQDMETYKNNIHNTLDLAGGYRYKDKVSDYYVYTKKVNGIEIEIKVRDKQSSAAIVQLHQYLDNKLNEEDKKLLTWAKSIVVDDSQAYLGLKHLIYNGYFYLL